MLITPRFGREISGGLSSYKYTGKVSLGDENKVQLIYEDSENTKLFITYPKWNRIHYNIIFPSDIEYSVKYEKDSTRIITPNGDEYNKMSIPPDSAFDFEIITPILLTNNILEQDIYNAIKIYAIKIILPCLLGLGLLFKTNVFIEIEAFFKYKDFTPTEFHIAMTKLSGIATIFFSFLLTARII